MSKKPAKRAAKGKGKAGTVPVGTRWRYDSYSWWEMRSDGLKFWNGVAWGKPIHTAADLDRQGVVRIPPPAPLRDTAAARRKAVAGVLGGWVAGTTEVVGAPTKYRDGTICGVVSVNVSAKVYAEFLARGGK